MIKCISASVYKDHNGDCSNGGLSSKYSEVLLEHPRGWIDVDEENPPENFCIVERRELWGENHWFIRPNAKPWGAGYMMGGCFIYSCDSRFTDIAGWSPLPLHDRCETQEQYDRSLD